MLDECWELCTSVAISTGSTSCVASCGNIDAIVLVSRVLGTGDKCKERQLVFTPTGDSTKRFFSAVWQRRRVIRIAKKPRWDRSASCTVASSDPKRLPCTSA